MAEYRIQKSNMQNVMARAEGMGFVRVSSNADGVTLDRVSFAELPVVKHRTTRQLGRRATLITDMKNDPNDPEYVLCTTSDVVLPYQEEDLRAGPESDWKKL